MFDMDDLEMGMDGVDVEVEGDTAEQAEEEGEGDATEEQQEEEAAGKDEL